MKVGCCRLLAQPKSEIQSSGDQSQMLDRMWGCIMTDVLGKRSAATVPIRKIEIDDRSAMDASPEPIVEPRVHP